MWMAALLLLAAGPQRQPQLAAAHGQVAMTYGAPNAIYFAASADNGKSFSPPVLVAEAAAFALGRHRGPRLAILKDSIVITAITGDKSADTLKAWRSTDRGKTWSAATVLNDVPTSAREGLHAMASGAGGAVQVVWLDLRNQTTQLYGVRSNDGGATWSKNAVVYTSPERTICECCAPSLTFDSGGRVWAMWRNALNGARDLYAAASTDGLQFDPARKLGQGTWMLNACPMDGGGFAIVDGQPVSAWRRESDVYLSQPGKPDQRIAAGKDVAFAHSRRGAYVAYTTPAGIELAAPGAAPQLIGPQGAFASLTALPSGAVLAAWEAGGAIVTRIIE